MTLASKIATLAGEMQGEGRAKLVARTYLLCASELAALPAFDQGKFVGEVERLLAEQMIDSRQKIHNAIDLARLDAGMDLWLRQKVNVAMDEFATRLAATPEQK